MSSSADKLSVLMGKLQGDYRLELSARISEIETCLQRQPDGGLSREAITKLTQIAHRLSGTGMTFGYPGISIAGKALETSLLSLTKLQAVNVNDTTLQQYIIQQGSEVLSACRQAVAAVGNAGKNAGETVVAAVSGNAIKKKVVLIAVANHPQIADLMEQLAFLHYDCERYAELGELYAVTRKGQVAALIICTDFSSSEQAEIANELCKFKNDEPCPPILYLSNKQDFSHRLIAVRQGGTAFAKLPLDHMQLVDQLDVLLQTPRHNRWHILIIDDDEVLARNYGYALESAGMSVTIINDPKDAIDVLDHATVDLVLLDFNMPTCNGFELASILRQLNPYVTLPIIFLSTEAYLDQLPQKTRLGIDDFLTKPLSLAKLVSAVTDRVERSLVLRRFMEEDGATRLLNHSSLEKELSMEIARSTRLKTKFSYAMIDLDHFKKINDTYGHAIGDLVIRTIAGMLRQRLRFTDVIGRYGGEEFGVILPGTEAQQALALLSEIHEKFGNFVFEAGEKTFKASFSGGIAEFPVYATEVGLNKAADNALYEAKNAGRNQLKIAHKV